ncbi:hypothetical protein BDZ94DRAFT_1287499 [Collybia nuda]|uniref:Flavin-containing monooxygenase n=1 Tax=Collybia nuda TaxID=64659 RepID=A0A9P5YHQ5_9AGAR|nr:hypothetical protein BDZ94DRAFT_1287499 [Collybia nuda]
MDLPSIITTVIQGESLGVNEIKTICIIGAGPAGLAALKVILDTPQFKSGLWSPVVYESRDKIGGVWVPAPPTNDPPLTPLYDSLTTNLPHPIMAFTSYSFPPSTPVFPHASVVKKYLEDYADHFILTPYIQLKTTVKAVERDGFKWKVTLSTQQTCHYDLVIVCNGHYKVPRYPNTRGLGEWLNTGRASHAAWYRHPHNMGNIVLVVGAGPSGQDISTEMQTVATTVIHSITGVIREEIGNLKRRGRVVEFRSGGEVLFEDGTTESSIDHAILATGYEFSFPFFSDSIIRSQVPLPIPPFPREISNSTYHLFPLAKHIFPLQPNFPVTSLAFLGLLIKVAPFPLVEAQARAVVQAFVDLESLNQTQEAVDIISRYEDLRSQSSDEIFIAKEWHKFKPREQFDYRDSYREVPEWEKEMYDNKNILRKAWIELVNRGEADNWVQGVGEGGPHEWIDLLRKMLRWAEEQGIHVTEFDKSKL